MGFYICNDPSRQQVNELYGEGQKIPLGPYHDQLRLTRFASVAKLGFCSPSSIVAGDIVVYFDERGDVLKQNGEPLVYVVSAKVAADGSYAYKTIPFSQHSIYSGVDTPPFSPIYIDPDKLSSLSLTVIKIEDAPETNHHCTVPGCTCCTCTHASGACCDCGPLYEKYKVLSVTKEQNVDVQGLFETNDYLFETDNIEDESSYQKIPCPILKKELIPSNTIIIEGDEEEDNGEGGNSVKEGYLYKCTIQANEGVVWAITRSAEAGQLFLMFAKE